MKRVLFAAALLTVIASSVPAVTITANFDQSMDFNRRSEPTSGSLFYASPKGWLYCNVQRKVGAVQDGFGATGNFSVPLDKRYYFPKDANNIAATGDYYVGFDFQLDPASSGVVAAQIGLFNSDSNNVAFQESNINSVILSPYSAVAGSFTFLLASETVNGSGGRQSTSHTLGFTMSTGTSYRVKMHVYFSGGQTLADVDLYTVDAAGTATFVASEAGKVIADNMAVMPAGMNALGVRNSYGTSSTSKSIFNVDNMYFSTTGFQNASAPNWLAPVTTATPLGQVTYTEIFRPFPGNWISKMGGGSVLTENCTGSYYPPGETSYILVPMDGKGYGYARLRRKAEYDWSAALYQKLPSRVYLPYNDGLGVSFFTMNEFWYGFDFRWQYSNSATCYIFGLFNSKSSNAAFPASIHNYQNHIGVVAKAGSDINTQVTTSLNYMTQISPMGTQKAAETPYLAPAASLPTDSYRFVVHGYVDAGLLKMELKMYQFDAAGNLNPAPITTDTLTIPADVVCWEGMDAFGIRNTQTSTQNSTTKNDFNWDNAWFSTVAPVTNLTAPSWFALNRADGNVDGVVNFKDLKSFASEWLHTGPAFWDMSLTNPETRDGKVNVKDLAIFAQYWL